MKVFVNGEQLELSGDVITIGFMLEQIEMTKVSNVAIDVNGEVISKSSYYNYQLKDGDKVEIIHFVGGG